MVFEFLYLSIAVVLLCTNVILKCFVAAGGARDMNAWIEHRYHLQSSIAKRYCVNNDIVPNSKRQSFMYSPIAIILVLKSCLGHVRGFPRA